MCPSARPRIDTLVNTFEAWENDINETVYGQNFDFVSWPNLEELPPMTSVFAQFEINRFSYVENELQREFEKGIKPGLANLQKSTSDGRPSKLVYILVNQYTGYKSVSEVVFRFDIPSDTARLFVGFDFEGFSPCELKQPLQLLANDIMWMKRKGGNRPAPVGFALEALYFRSFEDDNTVIRCASRTWPLPDPFVTDRVLCMCFVNE